MLNQPRGERTQWGAKMQALQAAAVLIGKNAKGVTRPSNRKCQPARQTMDFLHVRLTMLTS